MHTYLTLPRFDVDIALQAIVAGPVHVGLRADGNIAKMWRSELQVCDPNAPTGREWRALRIPGIPGRSLRGVLRDIAMTRFCELAGITTDDRDVLRLLFKGGKLDKAIGGADVEGMHHLREHCPPLALFGYMDNAGSARGLLQVEDLLCWTAEGVAAGRQARTVIVHHDGEEETRRIHEGLVPIPVASCASEETGYRRDTMQSGAVRCLGEQARKAITERQQAVRKARASEDGDKAALSKASRREANESMPWTVECIPTGVPLLGRIRAHGITEIEFACLALMLADWQRLGCPVGGKTASGFGKLTLGALPTVKLSLGGDGMHMQGRLVETGAAHGDAEIAAYRAWIGDRSKAIKVWAGAERPA